MFNAFDTAVVAGGYPQILSDPIDRLVMQRVHLVARLIEGAKH